MINSVEIVIPVYNEEKLLEKTILSVHEFMMNQGHDFSIVIANNGSTDQSARIADKLANQFSKVEHKVIQDKGRGNALRECWGEPKSDVMLYMDADLSTELSAIPKVIEEILGKESDIVVGSRLMGGSDIERSVFREVLSRAYNLLLRTIFQIPVHDAQCGFKAVNRKVGEKLLKKIENNNWFFDTELLVIGHHENYVIKEIPVRWRERRESKVNIGKTVLEFIIQIIDLKKRLRKISKM